MGCLRLMRQPIIILWTIVVIQERSTNKVIEYVRALFSQRSLELRTHHFFSHSFISEVAGMENSDL
jgi:hypothetical protein